MDLGGRRTITKNNTHALLQSVPEHSRGARRLHTLPGIVPGQHDRPAGCLLAPRCPRAQEQSWNERRAVMRSKCMLTRCFYKKTEEKVAA